MVRFLLRLSYDGGPFRGFAQNEGVPTVAGTLIGALEQVLQHPISIACAGRTDAGVHALDQVVHFDTERAAVVPEELKASLNQLCKPHIAVSEVRVVDPSFHARYSCTGRTYRYRIMNRRLPDPFRRLYAWRVSLPLELDAMNAALQPLLGTHDFTSFCRRQFVTLDDGVVEKPRVRELRAAEWSTGPDDEVQLVISASSFCQQMVRSITGLCVDVGLGRVEVAEVPAVLAAQDRRAVERVAPPHGLFLERVDYDPAGLSRRL